MEILCWLYRYRYLSAEQLVKILLPRSEKRFVERLGDLFHETGLIDRPAAQWRGIECGFQTLIYELSSKGDRFLSEREMLPSRATTLSRRKDTGRRTQFKHAALIVDTLLALELETQAAANQRFVPVDEIVARAPESTRQARNPLAIPVTVEPGRNFPEIRRPWSTHVIPDALSGIEYLIDGEKRYRFWALECENTTPLNRSNARHSSIVRKRAAYDALIQSQTFRDHWGIPNLKLNLVAPRIRP